MAKYTLVGYEERKGSFVAEDGRKVDYENVELHLVGTSKNVVGESVLAQRVKADVFADSEVSIGDTIEFVYDVTRAGKPYIAGIKLAE